MESNSERDLDQLHDMLPPQSTVVLFTPDELAIPASWQLEVQKSILQMVFEVHQAVHPEPEAEVPLLEKDVPAMLELTALTQPGPFLSGTIGLGNYEGIFAGDTLVAMAGQRLQPDPYTEISAVCTHPDHTGQGYGARLISSQIRRITSVGRIPFLHVMPDNTSARKLYEKLGFRVRTQLQVYVLTKMG
jgi:predicted GNAT family acetyltransferase